MQLGVSFSEDQTFVFRDVEVKETGRSANKKNGKPTDVVIEVQPIDPDITWKKWVKPQDLYIIKDLNSE